MPRSWTREENTVFESGHKAPPTVRRRETLNGEIPSSWSVVALESRKAGFRPGGFSPNISYLKSSNPFHRGHRG